MTRVPAPADPPPGRAGRAGPRAPPSPPARHLIAKAKTGFVPSRLVQRHLGTAGHRCQGLEGFLLAHLQVPGELDGGRGAAQTLVQLVGRPAQPQRPLLERPGHMQPPAGVTQVALELTHHTCHRIGDERRAVGGVVAVDSGDQPGPSRLGEVLGSDPAAQAYPPSVRRSSRVFSQATMTAAVARRPSWHASQALGGFGATLVAGYLGERLVRQRLRPSGWDAVESPLLLVAIGLAMAMAALGRRARRGTATTWWSVAEVF
jgi:hypothetical protein